MQSAPIPENEEERLSVVHSKKILDTAPEERFDRLTREAAAKLRVPISTISIIDKDREWFKSNVGMPANEGKRDISFCGHTITQGEMFIIEDTYKDTRFSDNPQVTGKPYVRFYAGVTLHDKKTHLPIGAFCVKDTKPRTLSLPEMNALMEYAHQAENELNKPTLGNHTTTGL